MKFKGFFFGWNFFLNVNLKKVWLLVIIFSKRLFFFP
jgi:hypothetical protein